jgi:hypothetical protein
LLRKNVSGDAPYCIVFNLMIYSLACVNFSAEHSGICHIILSIFFFVGTRPHKNETEGKEEKNGYSGEFQTAFCPSHKWVGYECLW